MTTSDKAKAIAPRPRRPAGQRPRREDPEVRRQELLRATISCLARLGPNATTGREICRQAGVSHSLLGHYFGNPQTLLLEAYGQLCDRFIQHIETDLAIYEGDPWAALDRLFSVHLSDEWAGPDVLGAWIGFWTLVRARADFAAVRDDFNRRLNGNIEAILARIPGAGSDMSIPDMAAIIGGVMDGVWLEYGLTPGKMSRSQAIALCNQTARRIVGAAAASN